MSAVRLARGFRCAAIVKPAASYRPFTVSAVSRKTFVDSTKDAARVVDRTVADAAAKGIEKGGKKARSPAYTASRSLC